MAQSSGPQISNSSSGACANADQKPTLDRPDILQHPYIVLDPPPPPPDAITPPRIIHMVSARVPPNLPKASDAETQIALLVDTDGKPQQVYVGKSYSPAFDLAVVDAVRKWQFEPAKQHGKPVQVKICIKYAVPAKQ